MLGSSAVNTAGPLAEVRWTVTFLICVASQAASSSSLLLASEPLSKVIAGFADFRASASIVSCSVSKASSICVLR
ncbi:hypothetical protein BCR37DRAFT_383337, partial [Protomyces lactucae-debilis]